VQDEDPNEAAFRPRRRASIRARSVIVSILKLICVLLTIKIRVRFVVGECVWGQEESDTGHHAFSTYECEGGRWAQSILLENPL
jgi:hypothetical protein